MEKFMAPTKFTLLPRHKPQLTLPAPQEKTSISSSRRKRIFLSSPHMSEQAYELDYIQKAFDTNWIAPVGANINQFEAMVANYVGSPYAMATNSGTAAIHLALKSIGVQEGDIVFVQSLTFVASVNPIIYEKAIPVLIDSEYETWNMDPDLLEEAFQLYQPKAVMVVHLYGNAAQMDRIKEICDRYDTPIIEDAAESLGSFYQGQATGTFGDFGIYSFNGNKIITTSGGGMLVSNNKKAIDQALFLSTQAKDPAPYYLHTQVGYNYRMSNVLAGIGIGQMMVLNERILKKRFIYQTYKEGFEDMDEIEMMPSQLGANNWLTCILIRSEKVTPTDVMEALERENIESRLLWKPMHLQPLYNSYDFFSRRVASDLFEHGLCLPSDTKMSLEDIQDVIQIVKRTVREKSLDRM